MWFCMGANHYQELAAFRLCEELMIRIEAETSKDPLAKHLRFCDQLNDAALDAASDVAEGFVRYYPREFARFLDFALASLAEVRTRTESAYRRKLVAADSTSDILHLCARSDTACRNLRAYLRTVRKEDLPPRPQRERPKLRRRRLPRPRRPGDPDEGPEATAL
jgi:four helix bundle protein